MSDVEIDDKRRESPLYKFAKEAAENAYFQIAGRGAMIVCAAFLGVAGWAGQEIWASYKEDRKDNGKTLKEIRDSVALMNSTLIDFRGRTEGNINNLQLQINNLSATTTGRFSGQADRINHLETDMDDIKKRVYPMSPGRAN